MERGGSIRIGIGDRENRRRVAEVLARAFQDDPLMRYAFPDAGQRRQLLPWLIGLNVCYGCRYGEVYATAGYEGAAIWFPPGQTTMTLWRMLRVGMFAAPLRIRWPVLRRLADIGSRSAALQARSLSGPHWYLAQIGVEPSRQREGIASRLLRPMLARLDAAGLPCSLETENAANLAVYERYGFRLAAEDVVPDSGDGLHIWAMARPPQR